MWKRSFGKAALPCLVVLVSAFFLPSIALSWGQIGHRIVAQIAEDHLSDEAARVAETLLRGRSLAQAATWPDEIRSDHSWDCAKPFHFVTVPAALRKDYPDKAVASGDALQALIYYTDVLRREDADATTQSIALRFAIHIVGDMHQPLHNGLGCDRGANQVKVDWFDQETNLHTVWDEKLLESERLSFSEFAAFLDHDDDAERFSDPTTPLDWIHASQTLLPAVYGCEADDACGCEMGMRRCDVELRELLECEGGPTVTAASAKVALSYGYAGSNVPIIRQQLLAGGIHLAGLLNWALDPLASPPAAYLELAERVRGLDGWDRAARSCRGTAGVGAVWPIPFSLAESTR